jgi:leucyl-tRNA synthetase
VNWCPALGTVLANDEVKDGVSERGGHPVERKRMPQWSMRITAFAQRLLDGLETLDWSESIKEAQRNWIGRSEGAIIRFRLSGLTPGPERRDLTPGPSPMERGAPQPKPYALPEEGAGWVSEPMPQWYTTDAKAWNELIAHAKHMRHNPTEAETAMWEIVRGDKLGAHIKRQVIIGWFIADFACIEKKLIIEVDGGVHTGRKPEDEGRTADLEKMGYRIMRFTNEEVLNNADAVRKSIRNALNERTTIEDPTHSSPLPRRGAGGEVPPLLERGAGGEVTQAEVIEVFTTRPDTIFGVSFVTLAPEHELIEKITPPDKLEEVRAYVTLAKNRSERERMTEVKRVSGVFTGAYVKHPFTHMDIPVWVGDYVLGGYGTGAVMAVPAGDQRDWNFATHFKIPFTAVTENWDISTGADESKEATLANSVFLNGLKVADAIPRAIDELELHGVGERRINFRLRDAAFGRQRYWGEPIPIYYNEGTPYPLPESALPLVLPEVDKFLPTEDGEPPLARAADWTYLGHPLETTTMPGWAGSSWYFLRYMDPESFGAFATPEAINYWQQVDLYVGGSEHATGHLLYFRFWTKFLNDRGWLPFDEPAKKLVNQGMIQGVSKILYKLNLVSDASGPYHEFPALDLDWAPMVLLSKELYESFLEKSVSKETFEALDTLLLRESQRAHDAHPGHYGRYRRYPQTMSGVSWRHVPVELVNERSELDVVAYRQSPQGHPFALPFEEGPYRCSSEVEKMSKSKLNVVNPDDIIEKYGADTLRLYEMFLGPIEQSKPWDTNGIEGTFRFLRKFWNLFHDQNDAFRVSDEAATKEELKVLHATLKKVEEDIDKLSFNTSVSQFMIACNALQELKCNKRAVLEPLVIALAPFAPHIAEEIWSKLGNADSVTGAKWPHWDAQYLVEDSFSYPISFNGKTRLQLEFPIGLSKEEVEAQVLANPEVQQRLEGKPPKKVIVVPKRIVNIVV